MKFRIKLILGALIFGLSASMSSVASAREMQGRFGLGFNRQFSNWEALNGVPGISIKYGLTRGVAVDLIAGVGTTSPANAVAATKFFFNVFYETHLNFYAVFGGGLVTASKRAAFELLGGMGCEFFIPGLESVGLSFEIGAQMTNLPGRFVVKTMGASFLDAGVHFYF